MEDCPETLLKQGQPRRAVRLCVERHGPALGRFCMALVGRQPEAEEILQEVFVVALSKVGSWRGEGTLRAWLFGIARNLCARHLTKTRRDPREHRLALLHDQSSDAPPDTLQKRARAIQVRAALSKLRPSDRELLLMRFESELEYKEIATQLKLSEAAVRKRLSRALLKLRDAYPAEGL